MSQIYDELIDINKSCLRLRDSIHKNMIFMEATKEQEDAFYRMLHSLIQRTREYVTINKDMKHVTELPEFYNKAKEFSHEELTFDLDELKKILDQYYQEETNKEDGNFVAAAEVLILFPLRMMNEAMHRFLIGEKHDPRFDALFTEINK